MDHEPWVARHTFEAGPSWFAGRRGADGKRMLTGTPPGQVNSSFGGGVKQAATRPAGSSSVSSQLRLSPDQQSVILQNWGSAVEVFGASTLNLKHSFLDRGFTSINDDGQRAVVIVARPGTPRIEILATDTWRPTSSIPAPKHGMNGRFSDAAFIGDSRHLLTTTDSGVVRLWRLRRPEPHWVVVACRNCGLPCC